MPGHHVLALDGPDALAFAQAQFSNDLSTLAPGQWQWSAWLNPKGRVIAVFALLRTGQTSLRLLLPDMEADELGQDLRRFVFRRKLTISPRPDLYAAAAFAPPALAHGASLAGNEDAALELDWGAPGLPRSLRLSPAPAAADAAASQAWAAADLRLGLPRLPASQREQWTPQQLALDRLAAYSVKKGCYPGQEIVARTHFLGKAKRSLQCFAAAGPVVPGAAVRHEAQDVGEVVCVAPDDARTLLLAVMPLDHAGTGLSAEGHALERLPLYDGLRR